MRRKALSLFSIEVIVVVAIIVAASVLIVINLPKQGGELIGPPVQINATQPNITQPTTPSTPPENVSLPTANVTNNVTQNVSAPPPLPTNGLKGEYFSNLVLSGDAYTRIDKMIDMDWLNQEAPIAGIDGARFSARWTGKIMIDKAGDYVFVITSDDGSRLYIDDAKYADLWENSGVNSKTATITLAEGKHYIKIEYKNLGGGRAKIKLEYIEYSLNISRQVVPSEKLFVE